MRFRLACRHGAFVVELPCHNPLRGVHTRDTGPVELFLESCDIDVNIFFLAPFRPSFLARLPYQPIC